MDLSTFCFEFVETINGKPWCTGSCVLASNAVTFWWQTLLTMLINCFKKRIFSKCNILNNEPSGNLLSIITWCQHPWTKPNTYLTLLMRPILTMKKHIYFRVNIDVLIICKSRAPRTFGLLFEPAWGFSLSCPLIAHLSSLPFFPASYLSRLALHITMPIWVAFQAGFGVRQIWLIRLHAHVSLACMCLTVTPSNQML